MKKTHYLAFILFLIVGFTSFAQEKFVSHTVQKGETVYSIAKQYGIHENVIYRLNPDVKNGMKTASVLILPITGNNTANNPVIEIRKHKVKRKETLFSISQLYNVSVEDLKKYNKQLYSKELKKKDVLRIPVGLYAPTNTTKITSEDKEDATKTRIHIVVPKETKYGIARKYGITIVELEMMNLEMGENLQIGAELIVPDVVVIEDSTIEDADFEYYEVQPKEGFFRLKVKLGLTEDEITALNPYAKEGLKEGMILKIPRTENSLISKDFEAVNLENYIVNTKKKHLAIMLPFKLQRIDMDSLNVNKDLLKKDATLRVAIDFYSGVLMATEFAKDKGISTHLDIYDTEGSAATVSSIIDNNNFAQVDAVIGPLLSKNIERAASKLERQQIPVFSPLSKVKIKKYSNLYQTLAPNELMQKAMLDYIVKNAGGRNIIIISGNTWTKEKGALVKALPQAITISPKEGNYFKVQDIDAKIDKFLENWVIIASDNPILVSNVIGLLNGLPEKVLDKVGVEIGENKIRLFTLDKNKAYDYNDVSNQHLANLDFTYPSVNRHYVYDEIDPFLVSYKNKYGVFPNKYAIRGFDVTYDVLLRLASAETIYDASRSDIKTEYIENKFQYTFKPQFGYSNNAFYIIKYTSELKLEVVE